MSKQNIHRIQENIPIINADLGCTISENFQSNNISELYLDLYNHKHSGSQENTHIWMPFRQKKNIYKMEENIPVINADPGCTISGTFEAYNMSELHLDL